MDEASHTPSSSEPKIDFVEPEASTREGVPLKKVKGVVNGHIVDVWVEDEVEESPVPAKRLVFELTARDVLHVKELTLNGVIDGKIARGEYTEEES